MYTAVVYLQVLFFVSWKIVPPCLKKKIGKKNIKKKTPDLSLWFYLLAVDIQILQNKLVDFIDEKYISLELWYRIVWMLLLDNTHDFGLYHI